MTMRISMRLGLHVELALLQDLSVA